MADRIKGISVVIGGDTTGLSKALSGVNKEISNTQSQLKDVERLLKLDPTNTTLLQQKQQLLGKAVGETKTKLDSLKTAQEQMDQTLDSGAKKNNEQYQALQREIISTEQDLKKLEDTASKSNATLSKISATSSKVSDVAGTVSQKTAGVSTVAAGAATALGGMAVKAMESADDLATMARNTGFSTDELQKMQYASELVDVSVDDMTGAAAKMKKNMVSDSKDTAAAFATIGVSTKDANGNLRDSTQVFYDCLQGLSQVQNGTERDTLAMQIFGKSADDLSGIIDDGGAALKEYGQKAQDSGAIMSTSTIENLTKTKDKIDEMKSKVIGTLANDGAKVLDTLAPTIDKVCGLLDNVLKWLGSLDEGQLETIGTVLLVIAAISPIAGVISGISGAISFLCANPIVLLIAAIVGLVVLIGTKGDEIQAVLNKVDAFLQNVFCTDFTKIFGPGLGDVINAFFANFKNIWDAIHTVLDGVIDIIRGVFTGDWSRAWDGVKEVFSGVFMGLEAIAKVPINGIIGLLNGAGSGVNWLIDKLNSIHVDIPDWDIFGGLRGKTFGFSIPRFNSIPYLANGGTLHYGSAVVGEAGPEMLSIVNGGAQVTPLGSSSTVNHNFGGTTINVYGAPGQSIKELAREVGEVINGNVWRKAEAL